ncbi:MAG: FumA C-terminus/TtdB family hydratase beta subunit [Candidatus Micrarchaeota archaeon]
MKKITSPISLSSIRSLKCGELVYLSGKVFTARDSAHKKMLKEKKLPFEFEKSLVIFHAGPIMKKEEDGWKCISLGPTTSSRMNDSEPEAIRRFGIRAIVGKGGMGNEVLKAMKEKCVYLAFTGGCAAIGASMVKRVVALHWPELGMAEGVWELEVEDFGPLIVAFDSKGKSLYKSGTG